MIKKCCGNDVAAFAKLLTYVCTATDGNMSVVALSLEKGFFAVASAVSMRPTEALASVKF